MEASEPLIGALLRAEAQWAEVWSLGSPRPLNPDDRWRGSLHSPPPPERGCMVGIGWETFPPFYHTVFELYGVCACELLDLPQLDLDLDPPPPSLSFPPRNLDAIG